MSGGNIGASSQGRVIRITFNEPDIDKVVVGMNFNRLIVERSTDSGLSWAELGPKSDRRVLEQGKTNYEYVDRDGDSAYLYRTLYSTEDDKVHSDPSDYIEGRGALLLQVLTANQLKQRYLFGVDLTNDQGIPLPDEVYEHYILSGIEWLEHTLDIKILPTSFIREMHDYYREDYPDFCIIQLDNYPVISLEEFRVEYPSGNTVITYPPEWIRLDKDHGIVRIVPTAGSLSEVMLGQGGSFMPAVGSGMSHLPDLFAISYTAGFSRVPHNILDVIGMFASLGPFDIFGDLIGGAGIANFSLSMDGLSQSVGTTSSATNAGYGARVIQYLKQIKEQIPNLRRYYKGIRIVSM